jgi:hypothetical protein
VPEGVIWLATLPCHNDELHVEDDS